MFSKLPSFLPTFGTIINLNAKRVQNKLGRTKLLKEKQMLETT